MLDLRVFSAIIVSAIGDRQFVVIQTGVKQFTHCVMSASF